MKLLRRTSRKYFAFLVVVFSLGCFPILATAASIDEIIQSVEQERTDGNMETEAYDDVMVPLNGAKDAQTEGDTESYQSYLEAARLVVTSTVGDGINEDAAGRILVQME